MDRWYDGIGSREATSPRSADAITTSTAGDRCSHASRGIMRYMFPSYRWYAGSSFPCVTVPGGNLLEHLVPKALQLRAAGRGERRRDCVLASRTRRTARTLARAFRDQDDDLDLGHEAGTAARAKSSLVVTRDQWRPCLQWHTGERRPPLRDPL